MFSVLCTGRDVDGNLRTVYILYLMVVKVSYIHTTNGNTKR